MIWFHITNLIDNHSNSQNKNGEWNMKRHKLLALLMVFSMVLSMFPIAPLAVHADTADWGARAAYGGEGGTELFLGGKYIELGISNWGDFGTMGSKPAGFRNRQGPAGRLLFARYTRRAFRSGLSDWRKYICKVEFGCDGQQANAYHSCKYF
jgi:hypothetical protein